MSKFLDKLERIWAGKTQPMGFGTQASRVKSPAMAMVARLTQGEADIAALAVAQGIDGVLIPVADLAKEVEALSQITKAVGDIPWGALVRTITEEGVEELVELGCDFLVLGTDEVPAPVLVGERLGKILKVETSLGDSLARAIARLPIDAVLLGAEEWPLTVRLLMDYGRLASLVGKPAMALLPSLLRKGDIEALWETGVRGVVLTSDQQLSQVKEAIQALPPTKKKAAEKLDVILPAVTEWPTEESEEEI